MLAKIFKTNFLDYLQEFFHDSKSIGIVLISCTVVSIVVANLPFGNAYIAFFGLESDRLHALNLPHSILEWINDGLMAVFFFLVGMEIKRELTTGELSLFSNAILPVAAAIGGMLVPAFVFTLFNKGTAHHLGWGIPMATDIAFSLGVAAILGPRFPPALKIFLTALAIIDDLGAIIVIAFFYGGTVNALWLLGAACCIALLWLIGYLKRRFDWLYILLGLLLWFCVFNSGIHATIAGVLFAFMVPQKQLHTLVHKLHHPVYFILLPVFALANTAIVIDLSLLDNLGSRLSLGIIFGLFFGKPIGIVIACWILVKKKVATLPSGTSWNQLAGAGILAGLGFTMSIFIASLAFPDPHALNLSKVAIILAGVLSVITAIIWMRTAGRPAASIRKIYDDEEEENFA